MRGDDDFTRKILHSFGVGPELTRSIPEDTGIGTTEKART